MTIENPIINWQNAIQHAIKVCEEAELVLKKLSEQMKSYEATKLVEEIKAKYFEEKETV